jgi:hypothetical protein
MNIQKYFLEKKPEQRWQSDFLDDLLTIEEHLGQSRAYGARIPDISNFQHQKYDTINNILSWKSFHLHQK